MERSRGGNEGAPTGSVHVLVLWAVSDFEVCTGVLGECGRRYGADARDGTQAALREEEEDDVDSRPLL